MNPRIVIAVCVIGAACQLGPARAAPQDDVVDGLQRCAHIGDDKTRLDCYDTLARPLQTSQSGPGAPQAAKRELTPAEQKSWFGFDLSSLFGSPPSQQTTPDKFGSDQLPSTRQEADAAAAELDSISATVTEYAYSPFGRFIVFLDNGQVWRQKNGDADHAHFRSAAKDNTVTISRGIIGSYNLTLNDERMIFKVERLK